MRLFARILGAAIGLFLFSQSAEFTQQYLQRLGGATDALRDVVRRFDEGASAEALTREDAVARLKSSPDRLVSRQGSNAEATILALTNTERRYRGLLDIAPLLRPFEALSDPDTKIAASALDDFRPAVPVTPDGLALTGLGFLLGWGAGGGVAGAVRRLVRRRKVRRLT